MDDAGTIRSRIYRPVAPRTQRSMGVCNIQRYFRNIPAIFERPNLSKERRYSPLHAPALLVPQSVDRVETGRFEGRIKAKKDADKPREQHA